MKDSIRSSTKRGDHKQGARRGKAKLNEDFGSGPGIFTQEAIAEFMRTAKQGPSETQKKLAKAAGIDLESLRTQAAKNLKAVDKQAKRAMAALRQGLIEERKTRPPLLDMYGKPVHAGRGSR